MMLPAADPTNDDPNTRVQRQMMLFLPIISVVYGGFLPAGLFIYWIVATIFSIVQQYLIVGWGSMFPIFGWTPAFAVDHTPRFPVAMPPPPEPSKRAAILTDAEKKTTADKTIRRTRTRTPGPTRETTLTMSAYKEFSGKTVEEALKEARDEFGAELNDLDFEILTPGSRGVLGMGAEPARIVAAPRTRARRRRAEAGRCRRRSRCRPAAPARVRRPRTPARRPPARVQRSRPRGTTGAAGRPGVTTAARAATIGRGTTAPRAATTEARAAPSAAAATCRRRRPPRLPPHAARSPPSAPTSRPPRPRPRHSPPGSASSRR